MSDGAIRESSQYGSTRRRIAPYNMRVGGGGVHQMQIGVPINRTTTRFMLYTVHRPEQGYEHVEQPVIPKYQLPVFDARGHHVTNYVEGQRMMAWVTQGPITDRTTEHLGRSDVGIALLGEMFREQMARGRRGPATRSACTRQPHARIDLPCEKDKFQAARAESPSPSATWARLTTPSVLYTHPDVSTSAAAEKIGAALPAGT